MAEEEPTPMEWIPTWILNEQVKKPINCSIFGGMPIPYDLIEEFEEEILQNRKMKLLEPTDYDMDNAYHYANEAIDQYNKRENENWEFVKVVTVNKEAITHRYKGFMVFITFEVKDKSGSFDTFQAKVWLKPWAGHEVVRCRKKRPVTPKPSREFRDCYPNPVQVIPASWKMAQ